MDFEGDPTASPQKGGRGLARDAELERLRGESVGRLHSTLNGIIAKYSSMPESDEIDLETGRVVVDRGLMTSIQPTQFGEALAAFAVRGETADIEAAVPADARYHGHLTVEEGEDPLLADGGAGAAEQHEAGAVELLPPPPTQCNGFARCDKPFCFACAQCCAAAARDGRALAPRRCGWER